MHDDDDGGSDTSATDSAPAPALVVVTPAAAAAAAAYAAENDYEDDNSRDLFPRPISVQTGSSGYFSGSDQSQQPQLAIAAVPQLALVEEEEAPVPLPRNPLLERGRPNSDPELSSPRRVITTRSASNKGRL